MCVCVLCEVKGMHAAALFIHQATVLSGSQCSPVLIETQPAAPKTTRQSLHKHRLAGRIVSLSELPSLLPESLLDEAVHGLLCPLAAVLRNLLTIEIKVPEILRTLLG